MVYEMTASDDSQSTASDSTDASILTVKQNNPSQEVDSNFSFTSVTALFRVGVGKLKWSQH